MDMKKEIIKKAFGPFNANLDATLFTVGEIHYEYDVPALEKIFDSNEDFRNHCLKVLCDMFIEDFEVIQDMSGEDVLDYIYNKDNSRGFIYIDEVLDFFPKQMFISVGEFVDFVVDNFDKHMPANKFVSFVARMIQGESEPIEYIYVKEFVTHKVGLAPTRAYDFNYVRFALRTF